MRLAEHVTFGSGALDRAAELRTETDALVCGSAARFIPFWRGKPLHHDGVLIRLPSDHPMLNDAAPDRVFLGRDGQTMLFSADLSEWTPEGLDAEQLDSFLDRTEQQHPALPDGPVFAELRGIMTQLSRLDAELAATARALQHWHRSHRFCAACGTRSQFAMGGWQRDCDACGARHFPRTDPVVIMLITHGNDVLIGRSPGWPEGMYSLLAGFVEPGETLEAAVRREVYEESGVRVGEVSYLSSQPWPFPASLMFGCRGHATSRDITIDPNEIEDAQWISREDMARVFAGQHPTILPARKGAIAHFLLDHWLSDTLD